MDVKPSVSYPGVNQWIDFSYTCSQGISPGGITLTVAPQLDQIAAVGDLTFGDGNGSVTLPDCRVLNYVYNVDTSGQKVTLSMQDRRWRWQFGSLSGRYNIPENIAALVPLVPLPTEREAQNQPGLPPPAPRGEEAIKPETRRTAQELARICLEAMGERTFNVSALDPDATPTVDWDATNPAQALQALCEQLGCRVVYRPDFNGVLIVRQGSGADLPDGSYLSVSPTLEARASPSKVAVIGARIHYQQRFALEAVGIEFDGSVRLIEDLSYKPDSGSWIHCSPPGFATVTKTNLPKDRDVKDARALASQCVFKMYRIRATSADGNDPLRIPPSEQFTLPNSDVKAGTSVKENELAIEQVRLLPFRNEITQDDTGRHMRLAARCLGRHTPPHSIRLGKALATFYNQTTPDTEVHVPFSIDPERQLITFSTFVFARKLEGEVSAAEIVLECACEVMERFLGKAYTRKVRQGDGKTVKVRTRDIQTNFQYRRFRAERDIPGGNPTLSAVTMREDIEYEMTATYGDNNGFINTQHNYTETQARARYYLAAEVKKWDPDAAAGASYIGVLPIFPDGAIQQVSWSLGGGQCQTSASRNTEHVLYIPPFGGRRRLEETTIENIRRDRDQAKRNAAAIDRARRWAHANG
jgi:hypothetical protein